MMTDDALLHAYECICADELPLIILRPQNTSYEKAYLRMTNLIALMELWEDFRRLLEFFVLVEIFANSFLVWLLTYVSILNSFLSKKKLPFFS